MLSPHYQRLSDIRISASPHRSASVTGELLFSSAEKMTFSRLDSARLGIVALPQPCPEKSCSEQKIDRWDMETKEEWDILRDVNGDVRQFQWMISTIFQLSMFQWTKLSSWTHHWIVVHVVTFKGGTSTFDWWIPSLTQGSKKLCSPIPIPGPSRREFSTSMHSGIAKEINFSATVQYRCFQHHFLDIPDMFHHQSKATV